MIELDIGADELTGCFLNMPGKRNLCLLDSCGTHPDGSRLLIAGIDPLKTVEISNRDPRQTLLALEELIERSRHCFFTLSYGLGQKLNGTASRYTWRESGVEPDIFLAVYDSVIVHDYESGRTYFDGNHGASSDELTGLLSRKHSAIRDLPLSRTEAPVSDHTRPEYIQAVERIRDLIRRGETYQANLTQQLTVALPSGDSPQGLFARLRKTHPASYSAYVSRKSDSVVSISPERFLRVADLDPSGRHTSGRDAAAARVYASPIKGTRPRGRDEQEDHALRDELLQSAKDRAENTMIVDLLRNDLGRVSEFGSVRVAELCRLEKLPSLFHLVSSIEGVLRRGISLSQILSATFPCGSITGCPKIRTMEIIDEVERSSRGLSMGAIGFATRSDSGVSGLRRATDVERGSLPPPGLFDLELSVAIRTATVRQNRVVFNVGGGIVYDSDPELEYWESLDKARAILDALGVKEDWPAKQERAG